MKGHHSPGLEHRETWATRRSGGFTTDHRQGRKPRLQTTTREGTSPGKYLTAGPSSSYGELFGERNQQVSAVNLPAAGRQPNQQDFLLAGSGFRQVHQQHRRLLRSSQVGVSCPLSLLCRSANESRRQIANEPNPLTLTLVLPSPTFAKTLGQKSLFFRQE